MPKPALRDHCTKPCSDCPFRRASTQGWLGDSTPEQFMEQTMSDVPMPCHQTIDYLDPWWQRKWAKGEIGKLCAGALIFFSNICKMSRDPTRPRLATDKGNVFSRPNEFIEYHSSGDFKSWEDNGR